MKQYQPEYYTLKDGKTEVRKKLYVFETETAADAFIKTVPMYLRKGYYQGYFGKYCVEVY